MNKLTDDDKEFIAEIEEQVEPRLKARVKWTPHRIRQIKKRFEYPDMYVINYPNSVVCWFRDSNRNEIKLYWY